MDEESPKKRHVPRFGSVFYWTFYSALSGFVFGAAINLLFMEDWADYWFTDGHYYACLGAFFGLIVGIARDLRR
jgi:hypothetical protein